MSDTDKKKAKVPQEKWVPERPFDSSEYLENTAVPFEEASPAAQEAARRKQEQLKRGK